MVFSRRQPEPEDHHHSTTNPLGGRVHDSRRASSGKRLWSGYVAHIRPCPACGWENDEAALFCVNCAADIRGVRPIASSESRAGVDMLQKRLDRERRHARRVRPGEAMGGGGWIAFGGILIAIALVVGADRTITSFAWFAAVASALIGIWQIRRDAHAMRLWGTVLAGCAVLMLAFVGFRAIQAAGESPSIETVPTATEANAILPSTPVATPASLVEGNVPMYGGSALHDGVMPGPAPATTPGLAWQADIGGEAYGAPTLANGILYVMSKTGTLYALEASTGAARWQLELTPYVTRTSPAVVDGVVYVGGGFTFHAIDAETGKELWSVPLQYGGQASPTVQDGLVVVSSQQGWMYALNAADGAQVWRIPTDGIVFGAAAITATEVVYATDEGIVYSVRPDSGTLNWRMSVKGSVFATPVVVDGGIYVTTQSGQLHALDLATGDVRWTTNKGGSQPPAVSGDTIVLAAEDGGIYGLDAATGEQRWLYPTGKHSITAPSISGNLVIVGAGNTLLAIHLDTGEAAWYFLAGDIVDSAASVADGYVFFSSRDGFLTAVSEREP